MKRHDTHLLSSDEEEHQYTFSHTSEESYNSNENYISNEQNQKSPIKFNFNENNNNDNSIISSKEIEDIFNGNNKFNIKRKRKPKKNKIFIKLKKLKINPINNDFIIDHNLTFTNSSPRYENLIGEDFFCIIKKDDSKKNKNKNKKNEQNNIMNNFPKNNTERTKNIKNLENKNDNNNINKDIINKEEKEVLYFFYNDNNEGNKRLKNVINIINKEKMKLYKVSNKNCFTIKTTKNFFSKKSKRGKYNPLIENYRKIGIERYRYKKDNNNESQKINYLTKNKLLLRQSKNFLLRNNNNINNNNNKINNNIINKNNNLNLSAQNHSHKLNYYQGISNDQNNKKIQLYNIYCKNDLNSYKKQRIRSTESLLNKKQQRANILEREENYPEFQRYIDIHNREKENRKIIKNMFRKNGQNFKDFYRHIGNDSNCPICQAVQIKNENNIRIKGIRPIIPTISNNTTQTSWQCRRAYSAMSRVLTKRKSDNNIFANLSRTKTNNASSIFNKSKSNYYVNQKNSINNININNISKLSSVNKKNDEEKKDNVFRKLNINRSLGSQKSFPNSNKVINFRNKNIKYN